MIKHQVCNFYNNGVFCTTPEFVGMATQCSFSYETKGIDGDATHGNTARRSHYGKIFGWRDPSSPTQMFYSSYTVGRVSINFVEHELGINHCTTVDYNNYLRKVCAADLLQNPSIIGGPNTTVEVDESLFSRGKNLKVECYLISGCLEIGVVKRVKALCTQYRIAVRQHYYLLSKAPFDQAPLSCRISGWRVAVLQHHLTVDHSMNLVDSQTGAHTQSVERSWKSAKERNKRKN